MTKESISNALLSESMSERNNTASTLGVSLSIGLSIANICLVFILQYIAGGFLRGVGGIASVLMVSLVIFFLFQIPKRFRNQKSRWKILMWIQLLYIISVLNSYMG